MNKLVFKALGDDTRFKIVQMLKKGSLTAGEIQSNFDMTFATVSHHLSILNEAGLITDRKEGKYVYYELNTSVLDEILMFIFSLRKEDK